MNKTVQDLAILLKNVLESRDIDVTKIKDSVLQYEVKRAIAEINRCRNFTPTDDKMFDSKYEYLIIPMCVASIAKIGAEGQTSHKENGISRIYSSGNDYPKELTRQIVPLVTALYK